MSERCAAVKCGRPLKDPVSRERGYGPKCWRKLHPTPPKRGLAGGAQSTKTVRAAPTDQPIAGFPPLERDTKMLCDAAEAVVRAQLATVTHVQRKLHVGAGRAMRLLDQLQQVGVVGPPGGREVLVAADNIDAVLERIRAAGQP
jgi:DNA segregation ATPase FtsK/SpoIIIE-like protein